MMSRMDIMYLVLILYISNCKGAQMPNETRPAPPLVNDTNPNTAEKNTTQNNNTTLSAAETTATATDAYTTPTESYAQYAQTEAITTETEAITTQTEAITTETEAITTETEAITTETEAITTETEAITTQTEAITTQTETITTETEAITTQTEAITTQTEAITTQTEAITAQTEAITAGSESTTAVVADTSTAVQSTSADPITMNTATSTVNIATNTPTTLRPAPVTNPYTPADITTDMIPPDMTTDFMADMSTDIPTTMSPEQLLANFEEQAKNITNVNELSDLITKALGTMPSPATPSSSQKSTATKMRSTMIKSMGNLVSQEAAISTLSEAVGAGNSVGDITQDVTLLDKNSVQDSFSVSRQILAKGKAKIASMSDAIDLSKAVGRLNNNFLGALSSGNGDITKQNSAPQINVQQKQLSKLIAVQQEDMINDIVSTLQSSLLTYNQTSDVDVSLSNIDVTVGRRTKDDFKQNRTVNSANVSLELADGLQFTQDINVQITTYSTNPFVFGENANWTNTPTVSINVIDKVTGLPPEPSLYSGSGYAISSAIDTNLNDNPVTNIIVNRKDILPQGKLHSLNISQTYMSLKFSFQKNFDGPTTFFGQMNIQPGLVDYDFKITLSGSDVNVIQNGYWKVSANVEGSKLYFFIYGSSIRQTGSLKLLVLVDTIDSSVELASGPRSAVRRLLGTPDSYTLTVLSIQPRVWDKATDSWVKKDWIEVLPETTSSQIRFTSNFFGSVTAGLFVPPNNIDFAKIFPNFIEKLRGSPHVFATVLVLLFLSIILGVWARYKDRHDKHMWLCAPLLDNGPNDKYSYRIDIRTGSSFGSGTKANIFIILIGEKASTLPRALFDGFRENFQRGSTSSFLLTSATPLGRIQYVFIWHDGRGADTDWKMNHLLVTNVETKEHDFFICAQWLSDISGDKRTNRLLRVTHEQNMGGIRNIFKRHLENFMFDIHVWCSIFKRPNKSRFSRFQRLLTCVSVLFLVMVTNAMWFRAGSSSGSSGVVFGPFRISFRTIFISFMSSIIILPPKLVMTFIYQRTRWRTSRKEYNKYKGKFLPWWSVYIGHMVALVSILCGAFFVIMYSLDWDSEVSLEWLSTLALAVIESVIILHPLEVVLAATISTCCLKLPTVCDDDLEQDLLNEGITHHALDGVEIPKPNGIPDLPEHLDNVLENEESKETRVQRDAKLFSAGRQAGVQLVYLCLVVILCSGNRGTHYYWQNNGLKQMFAPTFQPSDVIFESVYGYFVNNVTTSIYPTNNYNGDGLSAYDKAFIDDKYGLRIGPARIRQYRVQKVPCHIPIVDLCGGEYNDDNREDGTFLPGWVIAPLGYNRSTPFTPSPAQRNDMNIIGQISSYDAGPSYMASLGQTAEQAVLVIDQLRTNKWMDSQTRAVVLELTVYNANVNLFSVVAILIEYPSTGGFFVSRTVSSFRPYPYTNTWDILYLILQIIWLFALGGIIYMEVRLANVLRWNYWKDFWSYAAVVSVLASLASIGLFSYRTYLVIEAIEDVKNNIGDYVSFNFTVYLDDVYTIILALVAFFSILQLLRPLSFNYFFALLKTTLKKSNMILFGCFLYLLMIWISFGHSLYYMSVRSSAELRSGIRTLWTMFRMSMMFMSYSDVFTEDTVYNRLAYMTCMTMAQIIMVNLCTTVFMNRYERLRKSKNPDGFDAELNEHFWRRVEMLWAAFTNSDDAAWSFNMPHLAAEPKVTDHRKGDIKDGILLSDLLNYTVGDSTKYTEMDSVRKAINDAQYNQSANERHDTTTIDTSSEAGLERRDMVDQTNETINAIQGIINRTVAKDRYQTYLKQHPELWHEFRYEYSDGSLAFNLNIMPGVMKQEDICVEGCYTGYDDTARPDTVSKLTPLCTIRRGASFVDEVPVIVTIPIRENAAATESTFTEDALLWTDRPGQLKNITGAGNIKYIPGERRPCMEFCVDVLPHMMMVQRIWRRVVISVDHAGGNFMSSDICAHGDIRLSIPEGVFYGPSTVTLQVKHLSASTQSTTPIVILHSSRPARSPVRLTAPFIDGDLDIIEPNTKRSLRKIYRFWLDDWQEDPQSTIHEANGSLSFNVPINTTNQMISVFVKSGPAYWISLTSSVPDAVTDNYIHDLSMKIGPHWRSLAPCLGVCESTVQKIAASEQMQFEKGNAMLKAWFYNQEISNDKFHSLISGLEKIHRPDLVDELKKDWELFNRKTIEQVQAINLTKAVSVVVRSQAVVSQWRQLIRALSVDDGVVSGLDNAEIPLCDDEKLHCALIHWTKFTPSASVRKLQFHLNELKFHTCAKALDKCRIKRQDCK